MENAMKIGDVVQVLDDNLEGVILRFQSDNSIVIETKDGFELIYNQKEVIKIASDAPKIKPLPVSTLPPPPKPTEV